jgi:hypothetical protein
MVLHLSFGFIYGQFHRLIPTLTTVAYIARGAQKNVNINRYRARVNGIHLHYAIAGEGEPVLLWHGFPGTSNSWRKVVPLLARDHTVIVPDMRGFGDSDKPESGYDADSLVGDFREICRLIVSWMIGQSSLERIQTFAARRSKMFEDDSYQEFETVLLSQRRGTGDRGRGPDF